MNRLFSYSSLLLLFLALPLMAPKAEYFTSPPCMETSPDEVRSIIAAMEKICNNDVHAYQYQYLTLLSCKIHNYIHATILPQLDAKKLAYRTKIEALTKQLESQQRALATCLNRTALGQDDEAEPSPKNEAELSLLRKLASDLFTKYTATNEQLVELQLQEHTTKQRRTHCFLLAMLISRHALYCQIMSFSAISICMQSPPTVWQKNAYIYLKKEKLVSTDQNHIITLESEIIATCLPAINEYISNLMSRDVAHLLPQLAACTNEQDVLQIINIYYQSHQHIVGPQGAIRLAQDIITKFPDYITTYATLTTLTPYDLRALKKLLIELITPENIPIILQEALARLESADDIQHLIACIEKHSIWGEIFDQQPIPRFYLYDAVHLIAQQIFNEFETYKHLISDDFFAAPEYLDFKKQFDASTDEHEKDALKQEMVKCLTNHWMMYLTTRAGAEKYGLVLNKMSFYNDLDTSAQKAAEHAKECEEAERAAQASAAELARKREEERTAIKEAAKLIKKDAHEKRIAEEQATARANRLRKKAEREERKAQVTLEREALKTLRAAIIEEKIKKCNASTLQNALQNWHNALPRGTKTQTERVAVEVHATQTEVASAEAGTQAEHTAVPPEIIMFDAQCMTDDDGDAYHPIAWATLELLADETNLERKEQILASAIDELTKRHALNAQEQVVYKMLLRILLSPSAITPGDITTPEMYGQKVLAFADPLHYVPQIIRLIFLHSDALISLLLGSSRFTPAHGMAIRSFVTAHQSYVPRKPWRALAWDDDRACATDPHKPTPDGDV